MVNNPYDGSPVGTVSVVSQQGLERAIQSAVAAFRVTSRLPTHERVRLLEAIGSGVLGRAAEIAELITRESGKPIRYARAEVKRAVTTFSRALLTPALSLGRCFPSTNSQDWKVAGPRIGEFRADR